MSTWRERAAPIIAKVLEETKGQDESTIKKALFDVYPFTVRQYYPYTVWLDEIKVQRGLKTAKVKQAILKEPPDPNQTAMF